MENLISNTLKANLLENAPVIIAYHDLEHNILWANKAYQMATGLSLQEIEGKKCYSVWGLAKPCRNCPVITAIKTGEPAEAELTPENQDHWPETQGSWLSKSTPLKDENGKIIGAIETAFDITEHKGFEASLLESEKTLKIAQSVGKIGSWWYDPVMRTANWTEEMFRIFGLDPQPEAVPYEDHRKIIHPDDWDRFDAALTRAVTEGVGYNLELRITHPTGKIGYVNSRCIAQKNNDGVVTRLIGTTQDITDRKQVEEELRRNYDGQKVINTLLELTGQDITLEELLNRCIETIVSTPWLSFESKGGIFLVEKDPEVLVLKAQKNFSESIQKTCGKVPFGKCLCGRAALTQKIQFADGIDNRHDIHYEGMPPHGHYCVPILYADKIIGLICLYIQEGHSHDQREEEFLTLVSNVLAGIIVHKLSVDENTRLSTFSRENPNPILVADSEGNIVFINPSGERLLEELEVETATGLLPENYQEVVSDCLKAGHTTVEIETIVANRVLSWSYYCSHENDLTYLFGMDITDKKRAQEALQQAHDELENKIKERTAQLTVANEGLKMEIADRKEAEAALELSEATLARAQTIAHLGHWEWDVATDAITGSDEFYHIFETNPDNFNSLGHFREILHPNDRNRVITTVEAALKDGQPYNIEYRIVCSGGMEKDIHAQAEVTLDGEGQPIRLMGTVLDISERRRAEEDLLVSEEKFRSITTSAMSAIIMMAPDGKIVFWNDAAHNIFGWSEEEALGKDLHAMLTPEHFQKAFHGAFPSFKETGHGNLIGKMVEVVALHKNGQEVPIELSLSSVKIKGKWNAIGIANDISERKEAEGALNKAKELAEAANKAKSNFLSSMSHELRTPLTAIIGFAEVLKDEYFGGLNEKQAEYTRDIFESGKHLLSLINDILDLSKTEAGKMDLEFSEINIKYLLEHSLIMIKEKAMKRRIRLDFQCPDELTGLHIQADERKLKQILFNLLSNAVKFTRDGGVIELTSKQMAGELIISVTDSGVGISPEEQERVFEEFYQVDGGQKDKTPGTGLGLPISKRFVEMHGGKIRVESLEKDKGSRFSFTLPL